MFLSRTSFAYEETRHHLTAVGRNPLIETYLVQYLLIAFYAEFEERMKEIVSQRLSLIADRKVAAFIVKLNEGMIKRINKTDINDLLKKFDCGDGDIISGRVGELNLQPYFDAVTNRHKVSHDQGSTMTLDGFGAAIPCAEAILNVVKEVLLEP